MALSFSLKTIRIAVTLGQGVFSEGGNTRIVEGLSCDATIQKPGLPEQNSASIKITGLDYHAMEQLTFLAFRPLESYRNTITIEAGERGKELSMVFRGGITRASADFNNAPDPAMQFEAASGYFAQQIATPPTAVKGEDTVDHLMRTWMDEAGMVGFKNQGITASVKNTYYVGDPISKMKKLSHDIGFDLIIDDESVVILNPGAAREEPPARASDTSNSSVGTGGTGGGGAIIVLNKDTGMIGYPTFSQSGISIKSFFNPAVRYGNRIRVDSIVPRASGEWIVTKLTHNISAYNPSGGPWETQIEASAPWGMYGVK